MVLSLEFSTQHRRLEKLEGKMSELLNQKESLQSDYEALQGTNDMLKGMVEEANRGRALQIQETIKTEMLMGDAIAALDADLVETTGRAIQLEARMPSCANKLQTWLRLSQRAKGAPTIKGPSLRRPSPPSPP